MTVYLVQAGLPDAPHPIGIAATLEGAKAIAEADAAGSGERLSWRYFEWEVGCYWEARLGAVYRSEITPFELRP